ncbi:MAG TPA: TIGR04086 family membrane protein [Actinomycetota bacterium]|nr:TIGR04086 family membrane protein [Actinomycetota bacterium]
MTSEPPRSTGPTLVTAHPIGNPKGISIADVMRARGGFSAWSVLSGILVAFGAFVVLNLVAGAILAASGLLEGGLRANQGDNAGLIAAIGVVVVQFLAYLWGGYTAGRMARGSGWLNGLLVGLGAIILIAALTVLVQLVAGPDWASAAGLDDLPFSVADLPDAAALGAALAISTLAGGSIGGRIGSGWHTRLENAQLPRLIR